MPGCEVCFPVHGGGCAASYRDEKGRAICVFCADGIPCPTQLKILKETRASRPQEDEMEPTTDPASTVRTCKAHGCSRRLVHNNLSGFCTDHKPRRRAQSKAAGKRQEPADA